MTVNDETLQKLAGLHHLVSAQAYLYCAYFPAYGAGDAKPEHVGAMGYLQYAETCVRRELKGSALRVKPEGEWKGVYGTTKE